jgi:ketopantoate hydroxymethyltransferase
MLGHDAPLDAIMAYVKAVKDGSYPAAEHCFS